MIEILSGQLTMESKFFLLGCYPKTYKEETAILFRSTMFVTGKMDDSTGKCLKVFIYPYGKNNNNLFY